MASDSAKPSVRKKKRAVAKTGVKKAAPKRAPRKPPAAEAPVEAAPKRVPRKPPAAEAPAEAVHEAPAAVIPSATVTPTVVTSTPAKGVRQKDITAFMGQFIMMLDAGTPILKALKSLSTRGETAGIRNLVRGITEHVESGNSLWQAFARESRHFSTVDVNLIKAAEASGTLTTVLKRIVSYRQQQELLKKRLLVALIYPIVVMTLCLGVIVIISFVVIPMIEDLYQMTDKPITGLPAFLVAFSWWVSRFFWFPIVVLIGLGFAYRYWWVKDPARQLMTDGLWLRLPVFGNIMKKHNIVDFCRTFALMLRSGVSMMATLDLVRKAVGNQVFVQAVQAMRDSVERGEGLEPSLRAAERTHLIPGVAVDMLVTGEETGTIDTIADQIADVYDEEVSIAVASMGEILLPIIIVFMGGVVVIVALSVYLPMLEMMSALQ